MNFEASALEPAVLEPATVVARARVARIWRPCPTYARIAFRGPQLASFGTPGHTFDQRIKVLFPPLGGGLPELGDGQNWYADWLALPEHERGAMRTYSIRDLRTGEQGTEVIVDFVLHTAPAGADLAEAESGGAGSGGAGSSGAGPAALWASSAAPGDEVLLVGPRRGRFDGGGIEFAPGDATRVLLAGDETAAPAIARILEDAAPDLTGDAFIELPGPGATLSIQAPRGVRVHWLSRQSAAPGEMLVPRVLSGLGAPYEARKPSTAQVPGAGLSSGELVWETPEYSALGEPLNAAPPAAAYTGAAHSNPSQPGAALAERYFWIAGESGMVTRLRRHLVRDLGVHRSRVAFMGYWREGVAMR
ncbi:siderophore-interacting protein [Leucobacter sp. HY1910]